jgi:hypothetical protein
MQLRAHCEPFQRIFYQPSRRFTTLQPAMSQGNKSAVAAGDKQSAVATGRAHAFAIEVPPPATYLWFTVQC